MKLSFRLVKNLGLTVIVSFVVIEGLLLFASMIRLSDMNRVVERELMEMRYATRIEGIFDEIGRLFSLFRKQQIEDPSVIQKELARLLNQANMLLEKTENKEDVKAFIKSAYRLRIAIRSYAEELGDDETGASTHGMEMIAEEELHKVKKDILSFVTGGYDEILKSQKKTSDAFRRTEYLAVLIIVFCVALAVVVGAFMSRALNKPIQDLIKGTKEIAGGDLSYRVKISSDDEIGELGGFFNRMTERLFEREEQLHKVHEQLQESEEKYRYIFEHMYNVIYTLDTDGVITGINKAAEKMFGIFPDRLIGQPLVKWLAESGKPAFSANIQKVLSGENVKGETVLLDYDGREHQLEYTATPFIEHRKISGVQGILTDITERKAAEKFLRKAKESAEEASQLKTQFLSNVSHEVRTPLNCIIGFAETILHGNSLDDSKDLAGKLLKESEILQMLINDLLDNAKIEAGKMDIEKTPVDLYEVLNEIEGRIHAKTMEKGLAYQLNIAQDVPRHVLSDPLRLGQILMNLVINAIKFTEKGSVTVNVDLEKTDGKTAEVLFSVLDTGIGIPKEKQKYIFQSFTQADGSINRKYGGTGLGTTIAQNLVQLLGGRMGLESDFGIGCRFWFKIPLEIVSSPVERSSPGENGHNSDVSPGRQISILVVEDYPPNQEIIRMHLGGEDEYHVMAAENGREAVDMCKHRMFDLIYMDLQMPEMDGYEAARRIRQLPGYKDVLIVAMTANTDASAREECLKAGMNGVITKPIRKKAFLESTYHWAALARKADDSPDKEKS